MNALIWIVNGFIALLFFLVDHLAAVGLLLSCGYFVFTSPPAHRSWATAAGILALVASIFAPVPFPLLLLALSLGGWAVLAVEQYNPLERRWGIIEGLGGYALFVIGYTLVKYFHVFDSPEQGASYINAILSIFAYVTPAGILVMEAKSIFAHQPGLGKPQDIIEKVRTRGKE